VRHPQLAEYFTTALQTQLPDRYPIFVEIATGAGVEALPWETLCSPAGDFLSLDDRWTLTRIVEAAGLSRSLGHLTPPLRIAAVLSCLNVPAAGEWQALQDAMAAVPTLGVEMLVIVSEQELYDAISKTAAAQPGAAGQPGAAPAIRVELVPADLPRLQHMVSDFRPHILHLFCHGSAQGSPHLQLAVKSDWLVGAPEKSLLVEAREIRDFTSRTDDVPWLVVLNCCESAAAGSNDLQSLTLNLVYEGGVPAVVGMREPVSSADASVFTLTFYQGLFAALQARANNAALAADPLDWAQLVAPARAQLARRHPGLPLSQAAASTKEWTLPVVYAQPAPFTIKVDPAVPPDGGAVGRPPDQGPTNRAARLEIEALNALLLQLPPSAPAALRTEAENRIAVLTEQLQRQ
jgi:hypothetical protein